MNNDKRVSAQQQRIEALQKEVMRLTLENYTLKQLIPDGCDADPAKDTYLRLQKTLADTVMLKMQFKAAIEAAKIAKENYEKEINDLLAKLRSKCSKPLKSDKPQRSQQ